MSEFRSRLTIHGGLIAGLAVCRFTDKPPEEWPPDDIWVDIRDPSINCQGCITGIAEMDECNSLPRGATYEDRYPRAFLYNEEEISEFED